MYYLLSSVVNVCRTLTHSRCESVNKIASVMSPFLIWTLFINLSLASWLFVP